jgi:ribosomal protein L24E
VASTSDGAAFTFGYNDYTTAGAQCGSGSTSDKCQQYPGDKTIVGKADQAAGTITMNVPRSMLRYLTGTTGSGQRPVEQAAVTGVRFEDATAFSLVNPNSTDQSTQSFLYPLDNAPAFDFLLPKADGSAFSVPSAPTGVTATGGTGEATVSWTPSASDGGSPITGYVVTASPGGQTAQIGAAARSTVVKGLIAGTTYTFTVHAVNGVGPSAESAPSNAVGTEAFPTFGPSIDAAAPGCLGTGYWTVASDGGIFSFGDAPFFGSTGNIKLNKPVVGMARTPSCGGYWMVATDGGIFSFGNAKFFGSTGNIPLNQPIVGMAATPSGNGYWMVASDGGIFTFGDAAFLGSMGGSHLNKPIVGMAATPSGKGYWLVASDGGIFSFGDAQFFGSTGSITLNKPVVGMARMPKGDGYWFVASDGGIFAFGSAPFLGSEGGAPLNKPVVGMSGSTTGSGYWLVATDGGIFTHGNSQFFGSTGNIRLNRPMVGMAPH